MNWDTLQWIFGIVLLVTFLMVMMRGCGGMMRGCGMGMPMEAQRHARKDARQEEITSDRDERGGR